MAGVVQWRRHRTRPAGWLAATFGLLAIVVVIGRLLPEKSDDQIVIWLEDLVVALLVFFPYFLYRFTTEFLRPTQWFYVAATVITAIVAIWALLLGGIPDPGEPRSTGFQVFVYALLTQWIILTLRSVYLLWKGGRGQPTVARRRMKTLAVGALALALALVLAGTAQSTEEATARQVVVQLAALLSAPLFMLGFAPPAVIRTMWRREEEARLRDAESQLMTALDPGAVADALLPHAVSLLGGRGAVLTDRKGVVLGSYGSLTVDEEGPSGDGDDQRQDGPAGEPLTVAMEGGTLAVQASPYAPFFGREETDILRRLAFMSDLALARLELFEELQRSNQELEQFAYVASHDLQEPLRTVASYAELVANRSRDALDDKSHRHIGYVIDGCVRMQDLINDLLRFSRIGTKGGVPARTDSDACLQEALTNLASAIEDSGARIDRDDLPTVEADGGQLVQLFQNLIGNAIKFRSQAPPHISIRSERNGNQWIFAITDNGIGIDPKYADRIFTIFRRLHARDEYEGTGIGLAICKKIVEGHGGHIWVESDGGNGSTFRFTLPAA